MGWRAQGVKYLVINRKAEVVGEDIFKGESYLTWVWVIDEVCSMYLHS